jgi:hypothetical protein
MTPVFKAFHEFGVDDMPPQAEICLVQLKTAIMAPGMRHQRPRPAAMPPRRTQIVNPALFSPAGKERWATLGPVMILFVSVAGDRSVGW